jgi:gliding motility-associated-like protein
MIKKLIKQTKRFLYVLAMCSSGFSLWAQSASFGNTYVHSGGEAAIHNIQHTYLNGGSGTQPGVIGTDRALPRGYVSFVGTSSWTGAADAQHIDGYAKSYLPTAFTFPIGDNGKYRPARVSEASVLEPATAAYFGVNPSIAITSSLKGGNEPVLPTGTYSSASIDFEVLTVSTKEYWDIDGAKLAQISLSWDTASGIAALTNGDIRLLTIAGWDGTKWVRIASTIDATSILGGASGLTIGSITTTASIVPNSYTVYTLASIVLVDPDRDIVTLTAIGGSTPSIVLNDSTNGVPTTLGNTGNSTVSLSGTWPAGITLDNVTGKVIVSSGTVSGTYILPYILCDKLVPPHCVTDTIVLTILPAPKSADTSTIVNKPITLGPTANISISDVTASSKNGTTTVNPDGTVTYTPNKDFVGTDTIVKIICSGIPRKCDTIRQIIKVLGVYRDTTAITATGIVVTAGIPIKTMPGSSSSIRITGPSNGSAIVNSDGTVSYTPRLGFVGSDTVSRIVCVTYADGSTKCDTSHIIIKVTGPKGVNPIGSDPKNPNSGSGVTTNAGVDVNIGPNIVAGNGSTVTQTVSASNGAVTVNPDGTVTYKPNPGFSGTDTIKRVVCVTYPDGTVICETSYIVVVVNPMTNEVPNYISPNGDGMNDVWNIDAILVNYPNAKASIYNRWGNIVWRSTGPYGKAASKTNVWYGQLEGSGDQVPDGVYYYLIELEDKFRTTKTGFIELMRK